MPPLPCYTGYSGWRDRLLKAIGTRYVVARLGGELYVFSSLQDARSIVTDPNVSFVAIAALTADAAKRQYERAWRQWRRDMLNR